MRENPYEGLSALAYFGRKLKEFREKAGLSQAALAKELNYSDGLVAMVETARRSPSLEFAMLVDRVLKTRTEGVLELLWPLVRNQQAGDWVVRYVELEEAADQLRIFAVQTVPGLLQTEAYARAVFEAAWAYSPEEIDEKVAQRRARQRLLANPRGMTVWAVVDESVLLRPIGGPEVMRDQLKHLRSLIRANRIA